MSIIGRIEFSVSRKFGYARTVPPSVVALSIKPCMMPLVHIAATAEQFVSACEQALNDDTAERLAAADEFLSQISWDKTWREMADLIEEAAVNKRLAATAG